MYKELKTLLENHQKEEHKESIIDWENVPIDTPILVRMSQHQPWLKRHFAGLSEKREARTWIGGRTSFTSDTISGGWYYAKLWEDSEEQAAERKEQTNIEVLLISQTVFIVDENFEYCEAAKIEEITYKEKETILKLKTTLGVHKLRSIEELGKTVFFTKDKALAALKVDENGHPETYLTEFIKRFPEYQSQERQVIDTLCRKQIFGLENCHRIGGAVISPVECKICWNRPYKEDKTK